MFSKAVLSVLLSYAASVYADPAAPLSLSLVKQQFVNALITPIVVPVFSPVALLNVTFPATGPITTGEPVAMADAGTEPSFNIIGTDADFASGGALNSSTKYTLIMIDGDYAGATNPNGTNTHYLQNDLTFAQADADTVTLTGNGDAVIAYAGPGPAANSGAHRYIVLLFAQPTSFTAPSTPAAGSSVTPIDFPAYIKAAGFSDPIAGNYFTVEVGTSTVSASPTSAVNTATLVSAASGNSATTVSASKSGTSASASATAKSGASQTGTHTFTVGVVAMFFGAILA